MTTKRLKRPRDPIALAKMIGDIATGQATDIGDNKAKRPTKSASKSRTRKKQVR
jgi:hypothetical protein